MATFLELTVLCLVFIGGGSILYSTLRYNAPPWPSSPRMHQAALTLLRDQPTPERILEAGAGWGGLSVRLAQQFPSAQVIAAEVSLAPFVVLWIRALFIPNLTAEFRDAALVLRVTRPDMLLTYVTAPVMQHLKRQCPLDHDFTWVSLHFTVPDELPVDQRYVPDLWRTPVYLYKISLSGEGNRE